MVTSQEISFLTSAKDGVKMPKEHLGEEGHTVLGEAAPHDFTTTQKHLLPPWTVWSSYEVLHLLRTWGSGHRSVRN